MKHCVFLIVSGGIFLTIAGCAAVYDLFGTTPDAVHDAAVQKLSDYAEAAVNRKIDASVNLSEEGKLKLKAEVTVLKFEILQKIAEIKAKTDAAKSETSNTDPNTEVNVDK